MPAIESTSHGCRIHLHVVPRASRTAITGLHDGRVKLAVAAPPVDGEANDAILRFLSKTLGLPRDAVTLGTGATGKRKTIEVEGLSPDEVRAALGVGE